MSSEIYDRLKKALDLPTDKALAERWGIPLRRLQTWKSRDTIRSKEILLFCKKEGLDLNSIFFGGSPNETGASKLSGNEGGTCGEAIICTAANCIRPPKGRLDIHDLTNEQIVDTLHINAEWTQYVLGLTPQKVALVRVIGNNMSPWVTDGDLVIIDTTSTTIVSDAPYALQYNNVIVVKRLIRQSDGTIIARSDSQYCEDEQFADDATLPKIIGRVIRRLVR